MISVEIVKRKGENEATFNGGRKGVTEARWRRGKRSEAVSLETLVLCTLYLLFVASMYAFFFFFLLVALNVMLPWVLLLKCYCFD